MATMPTKAELKKNLKALRARLEERPMDLDARMRVARTYRLLGNGKEAVAHYRHVARYLSLSGHPLQAIAVLKELLQVDPNHEETLLFLAKLYARTRAADATNTGRVAVPILDDDKGQIALPEGIWRAICSQATDVYAVIHEPEDVEVASVNSTTHEVMASEVVEEVVVEAEDIGATVLEPDAAPVADVDEDDEENDSVVTADIAPPAHLLRQAREGLDDSGASFDVERAFDDVGDGEDDDKPSKVAAKGDGTEAPPGDLDDDNDEGVLEYSSSDFLDDVNPEDIVLPQVPLFSSLTPAAVVDLGHAMVFQRATLGSTLFSEGDPGDSCIVIASGTAEVTRLGDDGQEVVLMELREGDMAGLFALALAENRMATVKAATYLEYFEIDREAVDTLVERHPQVRETLADLVRDRLVMNLLAVLPVFGQLTTDERVALAKLFKTKRYDKGDALFAQGDEFDGLWVILEGRVSIDEEIAAGDVEAAPVSSEDRRVELGPGDFAGSFAGTDNAECDRTALAVDPTVAVLLPQSEITKLMSRIPDIANVRQAFVDKGLMVGEHVYAGNGRTPGSLRNLKHIF